MRESLRETLFLGVDGGGTRCRARLRTPQGRSIGEGIAGPANIRLGLEESFSAILDATRQCLTTAGLDGRDASRIVACLALAGASEPVNLAAARRHPHPFRRMTIVPDVHAACIGAHRGEDGGVVVIGTGTIGWGIRNGQTCRVGGWGFPVSDEGSGAWLGCEVVRRTLWAHDGRMPWTTLLAAVFEHFGADPHAIVRFMSNAKPRDFGRLAPLVVDQAARRDPIGIELLGLAAKHTETIVVRLYEMDIKHIALVGGLSETIAHYLAPDIAGRLVAPASDALDGALRLAHRLDRVRVPA